MKITNQKVTPDLLRNKTYPQYPKQKWVEFCEVLMERGFVLTLYEARKTVSKYITVRHIKCPKKSFKVRFSNHKPSRYREVAKDCDFFVGITHLKTTTTKDALDAVFEYFKEIK